MMESLYHRHHHHHRCRRRRRRRGRRRNQNHGFFKSKSFRAAHYEMQAVIGLPIIKLVVPRIIALSAASFGNNFFPLFPDYFTYFVHIRVYLCYICTFHFSVIPKYLL